MPVVVQGNYMGGIPSVQSLQSADYDYTYPNGLNLKPGSELHEKLKASIFVRAQQSQDMMKLRYPVWDEVDKMLTAYVKPPASRTEKQKRLSYMVIPVGYAALETMLTYLMAAFFEDPILRYEGNGPEDVLGAILLEKVIALQSRKCKLGLALHTQWRDALAYGFGASAVIWNVKRGKVVQKRESGIYSLVSGLFKVKGFNRSLVDDVVYEGNKVINIDPRRYLPDPNVAVHNIDEAEFVGFIDDTNRITLLSRERDNEGYFNCKYLKHISGKSNLVETPSDTGRNIHSADISGATQPVDLIYMYIDLVPSEFGVGKSDYPEKWLFCLAGDQVIIRAQPMGLAHDKFPITVAAPEYTGRDQTPISKIEQVYNLQKTIDWLFTSHISNVSKSINNMLVIDPSMVNINDLASPEPGGLIRLRKSYWGSGRAKDAIHQLTVDDITTRHISDAGALYELMKVVTGAQDALQGIGRKTSARVTAQEAKDTRIGALSRLEGMAQIISMQSILDTAYLFASHTQQLQTQEVYVKATGRWEEVLRKDFGDQIGAMDRMKASPDQILVDYDLIMRDGSIPSGANASLWTAILQIIGSSPQLQQVFNVAAIGKHTFREMGAKNIDDFIIKNPTGGEVGVQLAPMEQIQGEVGKGNLIPTKPGAQQNVAI